MLMLVTWLALQAAPEWKTLAPGIEYAAVQLEPKATEKLHLVRLQPAIVRFDLSVASQRDGATLTAAAWAREQRYAVVINAGMYDHDLANVGHLEHQGHINRARWNPYQSVFVFGPKEKGLPQAALLDRDAPDTASLVKQYASSVQNLRLIKDEGVSVWKDNGRQWSEAAVAQDREGRILFIFTRARYGMAELNERLLALPLGLVRAMHVDGGPPASLSIHAGGVDLDLAGDFESGLFARSNAAQLPVPNVLGVLRKP